MFVKFEEIDFDSGIWVLKYDMYTKQHDDVGKEFCKADELGAVKFTSCHGWYKTEADAIAALHKFGKKEKEKDIYRYQIEKVYERKLIK